MGKLGLPVARTRQTVSRTCRLLLLLLAGCSPDLKRVHAPDLWTVNPKVAAKLAQRKVVLGDTDVPPAEEWKVYTSLAVPAHLTDGDVATVAVAPNAASKEQSILVDLGRLSIVQHVVQAHPSEVGFPKRYRIDVAGEHNFPYRIEFVGEGSPNETITTFAKPVCCRFLRITLMEPCGDPWSVAELSIR